MRLYKLEGILESRGAFIWTAAKGMQDLNTLAVNLPAGVSLACAYGINRSGWIVGVAYTTDSQGLHREPSCCGPSPTSPTCSSYCWISGFGRKGVGYGRSPVPLSPGLFNLASIPIPLSPGAAFALHHKPVLMPMRMQHFLSSNLSAAATSSLRSHPG